MRNDGYKYYLRMVFPQYTLLTDDIEKQKFAKENPCFQELIKIYGEPVVAQNLSKQEKIKNNFLGMFDAEILIYFVT